MPSAEPLFFLARAENYKQGKISLLQAKSSILVSRNHAQNLKEISKQKIAIKSKIKREILQLNTMVKKFEETMPAVKHKQKAKKKVIAKPRRTASVVPEVQNAEKVQIDSELNSIEAKLRELANL